MLSTYRVHFRIIALGRPVDVTKDYSAIDTDNIGPSDLHILRHTMASQYDTDPMQVQIMSVEILSGDPWASTGTPFIGTDRMEHLPEFYCAECAWDSLKANAIRADYAATH